MEKEIKINAKITSLLALGAMIEVLQYSLEDDLSRDSKKLSHEVKMTFNELKRRLDSLHYCYDRFTEMAVKSGNRSKSENFDSISYDANFYLRYFLKLVNAFRTNQGEDLDAASLKRLDEVLTEMASSPIYTEEEIKRITNFR